MKDEAFYIYHYAEKVSFISTYYVDPALLEIILVILIKIVMIKLINFLFISIIRCTHC